MSQPRYTERHPVSGPHLQWELPAKVAELRARLTEGRQRAGEALLKEAGLNVVLTVLGVGATLDEHGTAGAATVQVLEGRVEMRIGDDELQLDAGALIAFDARVRHSVRAVEEAVLLITIVSA